MNKLYITPVNRRALEANYQWQIFVCFCTLCNVNAADIAGLIFT